MHAPESAALVVIDQYAALFCREISEGRTLSCAAFACYSCRNGALVSSNVIDGNVLQYLPHGRLHVWPTCLRLVQAIYL